MNSGQLRWTDRALVGVFALILFGWSMFAGRTITMHESRLPQLAREMLAEGRWLLPHSGGRPWLERPPLPHWAYIAWGHVAGGIETVWQARFPCALAGAIACVFVTSAAARVLGRARGIAAGLILATTVQFYRYATLAEDDIFLAACVAACFWLWVRSEFDEAGKPPAEPKPRGLRAWWAWRPWPVVALFVMLGVCSLAKGPVVGAAQVVAAMLAFTLWQRDGAALRRYLWPAGIAIAAVLSVAWTAYAAGAYPDVYANLKYDFVQADQHKQPAWYYLVQLSWAALPWLPLAVVAGVVGLRRSRDAYTQTDEARQWRFVLCWAVAPVVMLSIPGRKHHHYLVPALAGFAVLAAAGLPLLRDLVWPAWRANRVRLATATTTAIAVLGVLTMPLWARAVGAVVPWSAAAAIAAIAAGLGLAYGRGVARKNAAWTLGAAVAGLGLAYMTATAYFTTDPEADVPWVLSVRDRAAASPPLYVNAAVGSLDFFRVQFYLRGDARLVHNLTWLRDSAITSPSVDVITRATDEPFLRTLGSVEVLSQSPKSRREKAPADRLTLYRLTYSPTAPREAAPDARSVSVMQGMSREDGPFVGPRYDPPRTPGAEY